MNVENLLLFAVTEFLLSLTPGPAVLLVIGLSLRQGFRTGLFTTFGILATNAFFFSLSALGIGALILASGALFTALKWIGAAYLVYLGISMLVPLLRRFFSRSNDEAAIDLEESRRGAPREPLSPSRAFWKGFSLQASNPKNLAFFVAILPQFITPGDNVALQMLAMGLISATLELPILVVYGAASAFSARLMRERLITWIEGIGGGVLIGLGAALAVSKRS